MINYIKLSYQIKRKLSIFSKKISKNISRPKFKFIFQMIYGFLESNSTLLSNIARALKEDILLKKTIERLSKNLSSFDETDQLVKNYIDTIQPFINDNTIFCIDGSEITKRNSKVLEDMGTVRDGSTGETNVKSENTETLKALDFIRTYFGNVGIKALDRGYDDNKFYKYFIIKVSLSYTFFFLFIHCMKHISYYHHQC